MNPTLFADGPGPMLVVLIALPAIGAVFGVAALVFGGYWLIRRRRAKSSQDTEPTP